MHQTARFSDVSFKWRQFSLNLGHSAWNFYFVSILDLWDNNNRKFRFTCFEMVKLCSIINSLYGQVAGDLETCSRLWWIVSPPRLRLGATRFTTAVNKFPSPLPPDRTTNTVSVFTKKLSISRCFRLCHFIALAQNKLRIAIVNTYSNCLFWIMINRATTIYKSRYRSFH